MNRNTALGAAEISGEVHRGENFLPYFTAYIPGTKPGIISNGLSSITGSPKFR